MEGKKVIADKMYDLVLYNYHTKKMAFRVLKSPTVVKNPIYNYFYEKEMHNMMKKYLEVPFRVMIENTNRCNADCVFCPHKNMKRKVGTMPFSFFKEIIGECISLDINYATVYGFGEPLLDTNIIKKVEYAKSEGIERVTTNTNAQHLTKEKAKGFIEFGLDEIYISLDAATEGTYKKIRPNLDFKKVEKNVLNLIKIREEIGGNRPVVILSYVESDANKNETQDFISKWKRVVDNISISQIHNWTGDINHNTQEFYYRTK
ncbi:MAG: radical SAM protein, partial [Thermotogota bacterium]|nr:radical SAM protein [Thermotogota bacterium]